MKKQTLPYPPGFVEPNTGRVAVLVREYAASDLNGDAPAYWYSAQSEEWGLDPWRLVEGVDPHTAGGSVRRVLCQTDRAPHGRPADDVLS
jgi:hypothetical protein